MALLREDSGTGGTAEVTHESDSFRGLALGVVEALARIGAVAVGLVESHLLEVERAVEVERDLV